MGRAYAEGGLDEPDTATEASLARSLLRGGRNGSPRLRLARDRSDRDTLADYEYRSRMSCVLRRRAFMACECDSLDRIHAAAEVLVRVAGS